VPKLRCMASGVAIAGLAAGGLAAAGVQATAQTATSSGTFRSATYLKNVVPVSVAYPTMVAIGNLLGTGRDALVTDSVDPDRKDGGTYIAVYPQSGGKLGAPLTIKTPDFREAQPRITITPLYSGGQQDIVLAEGDHIEAIAVSGGRLVASRVPVPGDDVLVTNFNGDKYPDLLVPSTTAMNQYQIWTGSASHKFTLWRTLSFPGAGSFADPVRPPEGQGDFDHNGRRDVAVITRTGFAVRLQTGPGTFGPEKDYKLAPVKGVTSPPGDLSVADVTGDGYPDVGYPVLDNPNGMAVADLNGDGRNDLVVSHVGEDGPGVMLQRTSGTFGAESVYPAVTPDSNSPAVGDLNGDGKPDIALTAGDKGIAVLYGK
jgi:hypothetical protein